MGNPKHVHEGYGAGFLHFLRGRCMIVRDNPIDAVSKGVQQLQAQGFQLHPKDIDQTLRQEGSEWTAKALIIGKKAGVGKNIIESVVGDTPVALIPFLKRHITPTLAIVTARMLPDATCELVVQPFTSSKGIEGAYADQSLAAPRIDFAIDAVVAHYTQQGSLVRLDKPLHFTKLGAHLDCPAHAKTASRLTGFKM